MFRSISGILGIKYMEKRKAAYLFLFFFSGAFYINYLNYISQTVFNIRAGVDYLPLMYVILATGIVLLTLTWGRTQRSIDKKSGFRLFVGLCFLLHILNAIILRYLPEAKILNGLLYLSSHILTIIFAYSLWVVARETMDTESGNRLLLLVGSGGALGTIAAGAILRISAFLLPIDSAFLVPIPALLCARYSSDALLTAFRRINKEAAQPLPSWPEIIHYLRANSFYMLLISLGTFLIAVYWINDFQFNLHARDILGEENLITGFFGLYAIVDGFANFLIGFFLFSRSADRFGAVKLMTLVFIMAALANTLMLGKDYLSLILGSRLIFSVLLHSAGIPLFRLFYPPVPERYRSSVIPIIESLIVAAGMATAGAATVFSSLKIVSPVALNYVIYILTGALFLMWMERRTGIVAALKDAIGRYQIFGFNEIFGNRVSPEVLSYVGRQMMEGNIPMQIAVLDIAKNMVFAEKETMISAALAVGGISFRLKVIDHIFDGCLPRNLIFRVIYEQDNEIRRYLLYKIFLNYAIFRSDEKRRLKEIIADSEINRHEDSLTRLLIRYIINEDEGIYDQILNSCLEKREFSGILGALDIIEKHPFHEKINMPHLRSILASFSNNKEIARRLACIISRSRYPELLNLYISEYYDYDIINAFSHADAQFIELLCGKDTFIAQLYLLNIAAHHGDEVGCKYMQAAEAVLNKTWDITREIQKISRSGRKGMRILSDELTALRLSAVSSVLNYLFACHSIPPAEDLPDVLNNKEKLKILKDIVRSAFPYDLREKVLHIVDCTVPVLDYRFSYDALRLDEHRMLEELYRYLGGEDMETNVRERLEKLVTLKTIPMFQELDLNNLLLVSRISTYENYEADTIIIHEGDDSDKFFVVVKGHLGVWRNDKMIAEIGDDGIVGEMGVVNSIKRTATVRTLERSLLLVIASGDFIDLLKRNGTISFSVLKTLTNRLVAMLQN